jgi:hypothetical protein
VYNSQAYRIHNFPSSLQAYTPPKSRYTIWLTQPLALSRLQLKQLPATKLKLKSTVFRDRTAPGVSRLLQITQAEITGGSRRHTIQAKSEVLRISETKKSSGRHISSIGPFKLAQM